MLQSLFANDRGADNEIASELRSTVLGDVEGGKIKVD